MTTRIKPALTPEEWAEDRFRQTVSGNWTADGDGGRGGWIEVDNPHGLAARCLHGQPFGFTGQHRRALSALVNAMNDATPMTIQQRVAHAVLAFAPEYREMADIVSALLPPEKD